jgi:hypothetical protein
VVSKGEPSRSPQSITDLVVGGVKPVLTRRLGADVLIQFEEKINRVTIMKAPKPVHAGRLLVGVGDGASGIGCELE